MSNSIPTPSLYEIYNAVANDCYYYLYSICTEEVRKSIVDFIDERQKTRPVLNVMINVLNYYIYKKMLKSDVIMPFTSKHLSNLIELISDESQLKTIKVNNEYEYCFAYMALV